MFKFCCFVFFRIVITALLAAACDPPWFEYDDGTSTSSSSCYYVHYPMNDAEKYSWHQSQNWCYQNGANLASIDDIDERRFTTNITGDQSYNGALWIGLNRLKDGFHYTWDDGNPNEFRDWGAGEPNPENIGMCAYQLTRPALNCFARNPPGISTIKGLFLLRPSEDDRPRKFYFGYLPQMSDQLGTETCESRCNDEPECYSYTFISNSNPVATWMGECMGRNDENDISEADPYAFSGTRHNCAETGLWFVGNCGERRGFICKKNSADGNNTPNPTSPPTPTPTVPGYCPEKYFDGGGNKCFKIVEVSFATGLSWDLSRALCRAESETLQRQADLACIRSEYENAAVTMHIRDHVWGFWLGYRLSSDQMLCADNMDVNYTNWAVGKPSGMTTCVELWTHPGPIGTWTNNDCNEKRGYICQTNKDPNWIVNTPPVTPAHSCKSGYDNYQGFCYRSMPSRMTWSEAAAACRADGSKLVGIHSEPENAALFVFGNNVTPFWIGYSKDADGEWKWADGWPDVYDKWSAGGEPGTGEGCASYQSNGRWKDDVCSSSLDVICEISIATPPTSPEPVEGYCPETWIEYGGNCYYFGSEVANWEMANARCASNAGMFSDGSLASIHNRPENDFIYDQIKIKFPYVSMVWIGLSKTAYGEPLQWVDGSEFQYERWAPGEPNDSPPGSPPPDHDQQFCVEMYTTAWPGLWNDHYCWESRQYVCKAPKVEEPTTPYIPPGVACPTGCGWQSRGIYCYYMELGKRVTFNEAQEACVSHGGRKARIAIIPDARTNIDIMEMVKEEIVGRVQIWIGLSRRNEDYPFRWLDGSPLTFTSWAPGEPNNMGDEHCGEIHSDIGVWNDMNCETNRLAYICQIKKEDLAPAGLPALTTSLPINSNVQADGMIYVSSGQMAGVVIGTVIAVIALIALIGFTAFAIYSKGCPRPLRKTNDGRTGSANGIEGPYENQVYANQQRTPTNGSATSSIYDNLEF